MAVDCETLGFGMDCGHAFSEKYGTAAYDTEELQRIIVNSGRTATLARRFSHGVTGF